MSGRGESVSVKEAKKRAKQSLQQSTDGSEMTRQPERPRQEFISSLLAAFLPHSVHLESLELGQSSSAGGIAAHVARVLRVVVSLALLITRITQKTDHGPRSAPNQDSA